MGMGVRSVLVPVGGLRSPTGIRGIDPSTAGLAVVPAAATSDEGQGAVPERQRDLLGDAEVGVAPVREERPPVFPELLAEARHTSIVEADASLAGASFVVHGMRDSLP